MGKGQAFQGIVLRTLDFHMERVKLDSHIPVQKNNSKCFEDLNVRLKTIKLLEGNRAKASWHWRQWILGYDTKGTSNKRKNGQTGFHENFKIFASKDTQQSKKTLGVGKVHAGEHRAYLGQETPLYDTVTRPRVTVHLSKPTECATPMSTVGSGWWGVSVGSTVTSTPLGGGAANGGLCVHGASSMQESTVPSSQFSLNLKLL